MALCARSLSWWMRTGCRSGDNARLRELQRPRDAHRRSATGVARRCATGRSSGPAANGPGILAEARERAFDPFYRMPAAVGKAAAWGWRSHGKPRPVWRVLSACTIGSGRREWSSGRPMLRVGICRWRRCACRSRACRPLRQCRRPGSRLRFAPVAAGWRRHCRHPG